MSSRNRENNKYVRNNLIFHNQNNIVLIYRMSIPIDLDDFYQHISIALILVAAFAWNEAFTNMFNNITFLRKRHFLYAIFITILITIIIGGINYLHKFTNKEFDKKSIKNKTTNIDQYHTYMDVTESKLS